MIDHKITLYHANWSFCSQMVRVALSEKGLVFKKKHIKLCDQYPEGENIDKDFCGKALDHPPNILAPALALYPDPSASNISKCIGRSQSSQKFAPK